MSIIDFATFEGLRKQGISDDTIAERMASSNKSFSDQYGRLKAKSQGDPRATTAYLNYRFYGDANHAAKEPEKQKGFFGRTVGRMMDRSMEVRQSLDDYNAGEQGALNTTGQIASNLFRGALSPVTEGVSTVFNKGLEVTGLDEPLANAVQGVIGSDFGQSIINSDQVQGVNNFLKNNATGRTIADAGMAGFDALDFLGAGVAAKTGARLGMTGTRKGLIAAKATGNAVRHPIDTMQGFRGTNVAKGVNALGEPIKELTDLGRNAVKKGIDEKVVRFAGSQTPETKLLAQEMTREAYKGSQLLEGTTKHTEIVGQQVLAPLEYSLKIKGEIGSRLGAMKKARYGEMIDITEDFGALRSSLDELGVQIGNKGRIVSTGALPNDARPLIQQLVDFFGDSDGPVIKDFKDIDQFRSKMFDELGSAKGKVNIEQARIFDKTEQLVNDMRESIFLRAANGDQALIGLNKMYGQINKPISTFMQRSGIGKLNSQLNVDDLNVADLKAGQFSNRLLGNAAADSKAELQAIVEVAKKLGFRSNVDIDSLVTYRRALEDLYKVQRPSSLGGEMGSAVGNGMVGGIVQDTVRGVGATRIGVNAVSEGVMRIFNKMTGLNPDQQTKLLLELFNTSDDARLLQVVEKALGENVAGRVDDLIPNSTTVGDAKQALQSSMDDAAQLTPEQLPDVTQLESPKGLPRDGAGLREGRELGRTGDAPDVGKTLLESRGLSADDIMARNPDIQLKRDVTVTDIHGKKSVIDAGEVLTPYELKGNKVMLQDGETYIVSKSQAQNVMQNAIKGEAKPFAPEMKGTEETVKGSFEDTNLKNPKLQSLIKKSQSGEITMQEYDIQYAKLKLPKSEATKYSNYQLPDGKNYKEILIRAPEAKTASLDMKAQEMFGKDYYQLSDSQQGQVATKKNIGIQNSAFKSSHWDEPNVISHLRLNERTYKGKKVTFMEELQSDWAREGRSKGFVDYSKVGERMTDVESKQHLKLLDKKQDYNLTPPEQQRWNALDEKYRKSIPPQGIPNNPLLKNWQELSVKRGLKEAVDNNSEYFAWINGEQTSARYNLAVHLDNVSWQKSGEGASRRITIKPTGQTNTIGVDINKDGIIQEGRFSGVSESWEGKKLDEVLGKGLADKIMADETGKLSGEGLKFGGEWAENLYDKQVGNIVKDLTGGKVEILDMGLPIEKKLEPWQISSGKYTLGEDLNAKNMKVGMEIGQHAKDGYIITDILGDGKFKAMQQSVFENDRVLLKMLEDKGFVDMESGVINYKAIAKDDKLMKNLSDFYGTETFDISTKTTTQQGIKLTPAIKAIIRGEAPVLRKPVNKANQVTK